MIPTRNQTCTPIHVFTVTDPAGHTRRKIIPGPFCDVTRCRDHLAARLPQGHSITGNTWRSDYDYIDHPSNSQADYQAA